MNNWIWYSEKSKTLVIIQGSILDSWARFLISKGFYIAISEMGKTSALKTIVRIKWDYIFM